MKKSLIIDDDRSFRICMEKILEKIQFEAIMDEDGEEGLYMIREKHFDLIILDLLMPKLDGEQVAKILAGRNNGTPVVITSAYLTRKRVIRLAQQGICWFVPKPVKTRQFYLTIRKIFKQAS